jgi:hypothetical protein
MANANTPRGLIPYKYATGQPYNGAANIYYVPSNYATALYIGQPLIATGASDANGIPVVQTATAGTGNYILGPMVGIVDGGDPVVAVTQGLPIYHPASTAQYILVADDPNLLFVAQEDSVGGAITVATAGTKNIDLVAGAGSNVTGYSGWMLDSNTVGTGATLQMRIVQGLQEADNTMGQDYAKWLVRMNLSSYRNTTGI